MTKREDGGPAFPALAPTDAIIKSPARGLSLRDYFAAAALQGYLATPGPVTDEGVLCTDDRQFAKVAYRCADAMLAERSK